MKKIFTLLFAFVISSGMLFATTTTMNGITYSFKLGGDTAIVESANGISGHIALPSKISYTYYNSALQRDITETYLVTAIKYQAFSSAIGLSSIVIPNNIKQIGRKAFYGCSNLTSIIFPDTLYEIEYQMFVNCEKLENIKIPNTVKKIGWKAFENCINLEYMIFPDSLEVIEHGAFINCTKLRNVKFPAKLHTIEREAFENCTQLDSIILPASLVNLVDPFQYCENIAYLGLYMTEETPSIRNLLRHSVNSGKLKEIELFPGSTCCGTPVGGNNHLPFAGNKSVEKITIPANIAIIPDSTFMNCKNLKEVSFGLTETSGEANISHRVPSEYKDGGYVDGEWWDQVIKNETVIKDDVFKGDEALESVHFGIGVKEIGNNVCENCTTLTRIYLAPTIETIGQCAFAGCGLTSISIPNSITNLGHLAFMNNPLETVVMECPTSKCDPGDAGTYGQFANCLNITSITLLMDGEGRPYLSDVFDWRCFNNLETLIFLENSTKAYVGEENANTASMPSLTTLKLASTIKEIGGFSFYNTTSLEKVVLPASLKRIEYDAFTGSGIKKIISKAKNPPQLGYRVFDRVDKHKATLSVPPGRQPLYAEADIWKEFYGYTDNDNVPTTLSSNEVQTETTSETATVSYPAGYGAAFSDVNVSSQESGEELSFNFTLGAGLLEMPKKIYTANYIKTEDNDSTVINGYSFTIHSLEANTTYDYSIIIYDSSEQVIEEFTGTFTTLGETETSFDCIFDDTTTNKVIKSGQLYVLRGDKTYTLTGQEVR